MHFTLSPLSICGLMPCGVCHSSARMIKEPGQPFSRSSNSTRRAPAEQRIRSTVHAHVPTIQAQIWVPRVCSNLLPFAYAAVASNSRRRHPSVVIQSREGESGQRGDHCHYTQTVHNDSPIDITPSRPLSPRANVISTHTIHDDEHSKQPSARAGRGRRVRAPEGRQK